MSGLHGGSARARLVQPNRARSYQSLQTNQTGPELACRSRPKPSGGTDCLTRCKHRCSTQMLRGQLSHSCVASAMMFFFFWIHVPGRMVSVHCDVHCVSADPRSNVLLVFIPIGWALHFVKDAGNTSISDTAVFCTTFISIIPLGECGSECTVARPLWIPVHTPRPVRGMHHSESQVTPLAPFGERLSG